MFDVSLLYKLFISFLKVSGNPCNDHNPTSIVWKKNASSGLFLFLCTNRDWEL